MAESGDPPRHRWAEWDVLQHFRLVTDWVGNDVYLEVRRPTVPANPGTSP